MKSAETEGTGINNMAETEGTGIYNMAETEGTGIRNRAETEGTGISKIGLKRNYMSQVMMTFLMMTVISFSSMASELNLYSDKEGALKGIWKTDQSIEFVEGYSENGKLTLFVVNSLLTKATDNGTGDKATDNGTGNKATDNGTGNKATDNGTGNKATDNGTGEGFLTIWTVCKADKTTYQSLVETSDSRQAVEIDKLTLNGTELGCK